MNNKRLLSLSLLSLGLLSACGGGGGGGGGTPAAFLPAPSAPQPAAPESNGDSGTVSAPFARGERARYQLFGVGSQSLGRLTQSEQAASGAMTRLNDTTFTGSTVTKEIAGDENFAMGRWVAGTVMRSSGAETLTGTDNRAYHYVVFNELAELPATGSATCDQGVFTSPTYVGDGAAAAHAGAAKGTASVAFGDEGAQVTGAIEVTVAGAAATVEFDAKVASPSSTAITGGALGGGSGAAVTLGTHGANTYLVAAGFTATMPSGARYTGIAKFRCG